MRSLRLFVILIAVSAGTGAASLEATRTQCRVALPPASRQPNIFTPAQEAMLGEAIAERFEGYLRVIDDEALTAVLRRIGDRLAAHLPDTAPAVRMQLIDIPDANAFALPGGHVYVSRKLIGLTRSEDELAGVIGHELGHLVVRHATIAITRQLREVLGVTSLGDRQDVLDTFNRLMENAGRKPSVFRTESHAQDDQIEADRFGLALVSSAGYDARAYSSIYDRLAGTEGSTGSFFSRLFGTTSPDARRLAEAIKTSATLPAECAVTAPADPAAYRAWQVAVAMASVASREEHLPGLQRQVPLTPFRDRVRHIRFSPDGRYVLVQDDATVSIIQRQPFAFLFGIPAREARSAEFTPDSSAVILHTSDLRVERWSVAGKTMAEVFDLYWPKTCLESAAAPDGRTVACVDLAGDLAIIDAMSGRSIFQKKSFFEVNGLELLLRALGRAGSTRSSGSLFLQFSANGQYFAAGFESFGRSGTLVFDVSKKTVVSLKDQARRLLTASFTFVDGHRLVGLNAGDPAKSGVVSLPDGTVETMAMPAAVLDRASQPRYVLMRPWGAYRIGLFDVEAKKPLAGFETLALDAFDDHYVTDTGVGEIGLFAIAGRNVVSRLKVDPSPITRVRTAAVSPDFHWLAMSGPTRAVVWDLRGQMAAAYMRNFDASYIDATGKLYADIPRTGADPRGIVRLDLQSRASTLALRIDPRVPAEQYGPWLLTRQSAGLPWAPTGATYELRDVSRPTPLWTKRFDNDFPYDYWMHPLGDAIAFVWAGDSPGGRTRIARDERLKKTVDRGDLKGDALLEIVDAATGKPRGMVLVETGKGSFHVDGVLVRGDRLIVTDSIGRVLSYALSTGQLDGYAFGSEPIVTADGSTVAVETGEGRLAVLDARTMAKRTELRFKHPVAFAAFSPDGASLLVLTADQTAHAIALTAR